MSFKLEWDKDGERLFETGVDRGVFYAQDASGAYPKGEAWNGLTGVTESPSGAEATAMWADNMKYAELMSAEEFKATIEAYMYPDGFAACNGESELVKGVTIGQQKRKKFGFSYRSLIGSDTEGEDHGYIIHLVYGCLAAPSEKSRKTVNDSPEAITMSWEVSTTPTKVTGAKPTAHLTINSTTVDEEKLTAFEKILYGDGETDARMPLPDEIKTLMGGLAG